MQDRLVVTAKFAARLAGVLARRDPGLAKEIQRVIDDMKPSRAKMSTEKLIDPSGAWAAQIGLIDQMYKEEAGEA